MTVLTSETIGKLREYQALHISRERLAQRLSQLVSRRDKIDAQLAGAEAAHTRQKETLEEARKTYRGFEAEVRTKEDQIQKNTARLGTVKTNKEYQALLKASEEVKKAISRLEDQMLEQLERITAETALLEKSREELTAAQQKAADERATIENTITARQNDQAGQTQEIDTLAGTIAPDAIRLFETVRAGQRNQLALAGVKDQICQGCYLTLPPQFFIELKRNENRQTWFCPFCQRILYWDETGE